MGYQPIAGHLPAFCWVVPQAICWFPDNTMWVYFLAHGACQNLPGHVYIALERRHWTMCGTLGKQHKRLQAHFRKKTCIMILLLLVQTWRKM